MEVNVDFSIRLYPTNAVKATPFKFAHKRKLYFK